MNRDYVKASELAQYIYCQCCWMDDLEGKGVVTSEMTAGTAAHENNFLWYRFIGKFKKLSIVVILLGVLILAISLVLSFSNLFI